MSLSDFLFGRPLATEEDEGQRVGPIAGVPVLGLDALASAAYGPEALLTVLLPLGVLGVQYMSALTLVIIALLAIVALSYRQSMQPPKLAVLRSEYHQLFAPLLGFVTELAEKHPDRQIAVIVPELVELRWYHYLLHNHTASIINALLLYRGGPQIVIVSTPWCLRDWKPERRRMLRLRGSARGWPFARRRESRA